MIELNKNFILYLINVVYENNNSLIQEWVLYKDKKIYLRFKDITLDTKENKFTRYFEDYKIEIENNKIKSLEKKLNNKFIKPLKRDLIPEYKIVTYDIETYKDEGIFIPYACGWYNGKTVKTYYLLDYKSPKEMLLTSLNELLEKNNKAKVYIHNLSKFDYLFIANIIFEHFDFNIKPRADKIISITLNKKINTSKEKIRSITIYDSLSLLPSSLRYLAIKFKVNVLKGFFPYDFVDKTKLNYIGEIPEYSYYNINKEFKMKIEDYDNIKSNYINNWNLKDETINYLIDDLKSLYEVIKKFSTDIYKIGKFSIRKCPTISSVGFKEFITNHLIFKLKQFLKISSNKNDLKTTNSYPFKHRIDDYIWKDGLYDKKYLFPLPIIKGAAYKNMRKAYFGGVVDVFCKYGAHLFHYDVNSLYPAVMLNPMPGGQILFSTDHNLNNYFGIVFVTVNTIEFENSNYKNYPCLPIKIDGRMYNTLGKWTGWYFSEEVKFAQQMGYKIDVHYGYKFDKIEGIFNNYVKTFYDIKEGFNKDSSIDRMTAKFLLNALSGRFGLKPTTDYIDIVDTKNKESIEKKFNIIKQYEIHENKHFVLYTKKYIAQLADLQSYDDYLKIISKEEPDNIDQSISISVAITAYGRIVMFSTIYRLLDLGYKIYYMDTDCLITDKPIPEDLVGIEIGKFKLEKEIKEGIYSGPKLYYNLLFKPNKDNDIEEIKSKGLGTKVNILNRNHFNLLLKGSNVTVTKEKWYRFQQKGFVKANDTDINISPILLKRITVDNNNTIPFTVRDGIIIKDK